jgi:hypothetical protein
MELENKANNTAELVHFKSEYNLGLALPFEYSKNMRSANFEKKSCTKWFSKEGDMHRLEIIFRGQNGAAGALDQDVLLVLMSMCVEQQTDSPVFTYEEIRRRLGLKKGSHGNIRDSIKRMLNMTIEFRKSFYSPKNSEVAEVQKHLITSRSSVVKEDYQDFSNLDGRHSVTIDRDIKDNLIKGYYSVLHRPTYIKLPSGAVRRLYQMLNVRRDLSGDTFSLEFEEIASVLGLRNKDKFTYYIKKYFRELEKGYPNINYVYTSLNRKKIVKVTFISIESNLSNDTFFTALNDFYGEDKVKQLGIDLDYVDDLRIKYPKILVYEKCNRPIVDLFLDMLLFQKFCLNGKIESIKALLNFVLKKGEIQKPDGYRKFVIDRVKQKEIIEAKELAIKEKEKKGVENAIKETKTNEIVDKTFLTIKEDNPKLYKKLEKEAMKRTKPEVQGSFLFDQIIDEKIREIIKVKMEAGESINQF